jgi:hypothetical protein
MSGGLGMTASEQVELALLPANSRVLGRIEGLNGRLLRVRAELPIQSGTLLKTSWNGNIILGEVMKREDDGAVLVNIRHWLEPADLRDMSKNWVSADKTV